MTRIDGIIILDTIGKPLITSHFSTHPPSYPSVHIDAFNHALKLTQSSSEELDPVLWVNTLSRVNGSMGMTGAGLCHVEREGLRFLVPVAHEVNPLFAFSFLGSFLETLQDYLGEITETTIKDNFDIVYMLIEEMLDEGHPMTMESAMLKEIVLPPSLMRKLLSVAGVSALQSPAAAPFTAPIPWRRPGIRHSTNEIYFDIEESLDMILDRRGTVLSSGIWGRINCNSRLSGNPDLLLTLGDHKVMHNCSFHPCIRYTKWERDQILSFIPPDGKFKLLEYQAKAGSSLAKPLSLKAGMSVDENGGRFSLTLTPRLNHQALEDIIISINLGSGATSVSATATGDRRPIGVSANGLSAGGNRDDGAASGGVGGGSWEFDPHTQVRKSFAVDAASEQQKLLRWTLSSLSSSERPPTLTGSFVSTESQPVPAPSFIIAFIIQSHSFSGIKVDQLKVQGDIVYKPFKGVRTSAKAGKVEVRW
ncbi:MAG: hypothetical protein TREMPRED_005960 [Tremellales sp. Tagirdzhanova-0007]|nr:MAG: hypothetical protein TREMPRED_005960 [Tremellales sp. Tagirdzhanova-0007]